MDRKEVGQTAAAASSAALTHHARIIADIEQSILDGAWPPGHRLPNEIDLARDYGCSRATANKALSQLARAGLIERRKRAGSVVARPGVRTAMLQIRDPRSEVEATGSTYRYDLRLDEERSGAPDQLPWPDIEPETPVRHLQALHLAEDHPFCLEQRLISLAAVPTAAEIDFSAIPPSTWLLEIVPWTSAEHHISAAAADPGTAEALAIAPGASCLVVDRRTWNSGIPVTRARLVYPAGSHSLVARFTPSGS